MESSYWTPELLLLGLGGIAALLTRLRHQVELSGLCADLQSVVDETVKPAHVSLWLRD